MRHVHYEFRSAHIQFLFPEMIFFEAIIYELLSFRSGGNGNKKWTKSRRKTFPNSILHFPTDFVYFYGNEEKSFEYK